MPKRLHSNLEEAANRAEASALLIRCGYRVYRPEADFEGEDLVLRAPSGELRAVQLKSRVYVSKKRYGDKSIWMLMPSGPAGVGSTRRWFLIPHDELYRHIEARHCQAPTWQGEWSYPTCPKHIEALLGPYEICMPLPQ